MNEEILAKARRELRPEVFAAIEAYGRAQANAALLEACKAAAQFIANREHYQPQLAAILEAAITGTERITE